MTFNQISLALYATFITNYYGFKLKRTNDPKEMKRLRCDYANAMFKRLNIEIKVIHKERIPQEGQYLLVSNHRTVLDPTIVEIATQDSEIFGYWIAKKELYKSFFFGSFTRNGGTVLLDRESDSMSGFFTEVKERVKEGVSIYIFPEGTRNKTEDEIAPFQGGAQVIAMKNRLPMLPVFIRNQANKILKEAIVDSKQKRVIEIEIGEIMDYKDKSLPLEDAYKKQFNIS